MLNYCCCPKATCYKGRSPRLGTIRFKLSLLLVCLLASYFTTLSIGSFPYSPPPTPSIKGDSNIHWDNIKICQQPRLAWCKIRAHYRGDFSVERARVGCPCQSPWSSQGSVPLPDPATPGGRCIYPWFGADSATHSAPWPAGCRGRRSGGWPLHCWLSWGRKPYMWAIFLWNHLYLTTAVCLEWKPVLTFFRSFEWRSPTSSWKRQRKKKERPHAELWRGCLRMHTCIVEQLNLFFAFKKWITSPWFP